MKYIFVLFLFPTLAFALTKKEAYQLLADAGEDLTVSGAICEHVARLELDREFPADRYAITNGIAYGKPPSTTGELDVIVFEKPHMNVVFVAEVKCSRNLPSAAAKARKQRQRFLDTMASRKPVKLWDVKTKKEYDLALFQGVKKFQSISNHGGVGKGFDRELEMELVDLMDLRQEIMSCQGAGRCRRP